jgi:hypothetical protein
MSYIIIVQQNQTDLALNANHIVYFEPISETSKTMVFPSKWGRIGDR